MLLSIPESRIAIFAHKAWYPDDKLSIEGIKARRPDDQPNSWVSQKANYGSRVLFRAQIPNTEGYPERQGV